MLAELSHRITEKRNELHALGESLYDFYPATFGPDMSAKGAPFVYDTMKQCVWLDLDGVTFDISYDHSVAARDQALIPYNVQPLDTDGQMPVGDMDPLKLLQLNLTPLAADEAWSVPLCTPIREVDTNCLVGPRIGFSWTPNLI
jgi:hypothetical protein